MGICLENNGSHPSALTAFLQNYLTDSYCSELYQLFHRNGLLPTSLKIFKEVSEVLVFF